MNVIHKITFKITYAKIQHFHKLNSSYWLLPFKSMFFSLLSLHWVTINLMDEYLKAMLQLHIGNLELWHLKRKIEYSAEHHCLHFFAMETWVRVCKDHLPPGFYSVSFQSGLELIRFGFSCVTFLEESLSIPTRIWIVAFYWILIIREVIINCLQFSYQMYGTVNKTISWLKLAQWRLRVTHFTHRWFIVNWSITVSHTGRLQITANLADFFISALVSLKGTVPKGFIFHPLPKFDFSTPLLMKAELIRI